MHTLGFVADEELELDEDEPVETLRTFMVATSSPEEIKLNLDKFESILAPRLDRCWSDFGSNLDRCLARFWIEFGTIHGSLVCCSTHVWKSPSLKRATLDTHDLLDRLGQTWADKNY